MAGGLTLVDQRTNRQFDSFPYQGILLLFIAMLGQLLL